MLRSKAIPEILDRICDASSIDSALFLNSDGELLGSNSAYDEPEELGTLLADIALDYQYLGDEYATIMEGDGENENENEEDQMSQLKFVLIEMEAGLVGIAACPGIECFVISISKNIHTPRGLITARLKELSTYLQESLVPLIERGP
jgi:hypothetical protein